MLPQAFRDRSSSIPLLPTRIPWDRPMEVLLCHLKDVKLRVA